MAITIAMGLNIHKILEAVSVEFEVPVEELVGDTRGSPDASLARQVVMYLGTFAHGGPYLDGAKAAVGVELSRARTTTGYGVRAVLARIKRSLQFGSIGLRPS